jgi:hypothetical protein
MREALFRSHGIMGNPEAVSLFPKPFDLFQSASLCLRYPLEYDTKPNQADQGIEPKYPG